MGMTVNDSGLIFSNRDSTDQWAQYAIFLCAQTVNLKCEHEKMLRSEVESQPPGFAQRWKGLWDELSAWYEKRPSEVYPIFEAPAGDPASFQDSPFATIIFTTSSAACANQLYHTAVLLLLQCKPRTLKVSTSKGSSASRLRHAQQICAIAISNDGPQRWDLSMAASMLVAAKLMTHEDQLRAVVAALEAAERTMGWRLGEEVEKLQRQWSLANAVDL
jgi:hypothetical protein